MYPSTPLPRGVSDSSKSKRNWPSVARDGGVCPVTTVGTVIAAITAAHAKISIFIAQSSPRRLLMAAEAEPHGGEHLVGELRLAARAESLVERRRQHGRRDCLVDRGLDRPAPLARVRDASGEPGEVGIGEQRARSQI